MKTSRSKGVKIIMSYRDTFYSWSSLKEGGFGRGRVLTIFLWKKGTTLWYATLSKTFLVWGSENRPFLVVG